METQESNIAKVFGVKWWTICSLMLFFSCSSKEKKVPYYHTPDLSPVWTTSHDKVHVIDDFKFLNQDGEDFGSDQLSGKIYVANFFFTSCPSICPRMTENLSTVAEQYQFDSLIRLVSFSVTPNVDSVSRLKDYHTGKDLTSNWNLLTGNQKDIYQLSRESFFVEEEIGFSKDSSDFLHTERCILVDQKKHIRGVYNATVQLDMKRLMEDIKLIKNEG